MTSRKLPSSLLLWAVIVAAVLFASSTPAASLPPAARVEIESLLSRLGASGCQFYRNGSWHASGEAQAHLRRKLDFLAEKGALASTELFIERAATKSSASGQLYLVRCGTSPPVSSSLWLHEQLRVLRAASPSPAPAGINPR